MSLLLAGRQETLAPYLHELQRLLPDERIVLWSPDLPEAEREHIDIAVIGNPPPGCLQGLPRLRLIQSLWAGVDRLLADASLPADVPLARMVDPAMNVAMAETALWAVLSLQRGWFDCLEQQRRGQWRVPPQPRADEVCVGVLGLGQMGRTVAARLAANGYRVLGWSRSGAQLPGITALHGDAGLQQLLGEAHIVVNLLPLTPATRGLFDAATFARMRAGASLVNLARGQHVVDEALLAALDAGHLHRAVLDVFHVEPLPPGHPYWQHPRVVVLPHAAAQTDPRSACQVVADNVRALRCGAPLAHLVDRARGY
ncbi:2-hydroxyacid dehydrogenase [Caldimonas thermodepolymerans]|uniref:Glyoxylate/hydroxypyruvate reductase A n=1 Tax=Caldimonas thermodepolymerans TaxID=215580 RepID=A0AA46DCH0_9BURK|nr:glyoxylate/hydroxypyruvate reductase A [Caldimonas thermodepolymerans]TCP05003.1 glyoxylate/hydroxypyruvate reductase A [Caldimonas thermodepolymerans]UZG44720.1 glyoxylate/hydroxypyruvate reductase A [Caldimonas thermodepolymerans]UZG48376.1 glyoxylate/hydroxypyruvate reductase A [Caldimonas thermodepolymerans]